MKDTLKRKACRDALAYPKCIHSLGIRQYSMKYYSNTRPSIETLNGQSYDFKFGIRSVREKVTHINGIDKHEYVVGCSFKRVRDTWMNIGEIVTEHCEEGNPYNEVSVVYTIQHYKM